MPPLHLFGPRVLLRRFNPNDVEVLAKIANDRQVWLRLRDVFPFPYAQSDARDWIARCQLEQPPLNFAIEHQGQLVGVIGCVAGQDIYAGSAEVGYWIGQKFWGRGLASEALSLCTSYAFEVLQLRRLWAEVFADNPASMRVLEKVGFLREGLRRQAAIKAGEVLDCVIFSLLPGDLGPQS